MTVMKYGVMAARDMPAKAKNSKAMEKKSRRMSMMSLYFAERGQRGHESGVTLLGANLNRGRFWRLDRLGRWRRSTIIGRVELLAGVKFIERSEPVAHGANTFSLGFMIGLDYDVLVRHIAVATDVTG